MRAPAILFRTKIAQPDRLAEIVVEKADETRAVDQRYLRGQEQRRPVDAWERNAAGSEYFQNHGL